ncbi:hypothetical protein HNQ02_002767 [Flavobacterium sp. 7E]|uniref:DUF4349 domain-containing protein n=1 Tax=unclassified Flavobacterium TaxID=196869 RepID=UPI00156E2D9A|nr:MULTISPECIES: DUF4349 domain-containing protein [unclassified Flavobacterium]NRS89833.1 hypothetical protein [Flavobacterium sp. 7E]NRT16640.1 hypothetical protein [Flavobacterium sp. 28A]
MTKIAKCSFLLLATISLMTSCKKNESREEYAEEQASSSVSADSISSSAAVEKPGSDRKFIRTADIKFKVKNVPQSTYVIENITNKFDGFVIYTNLQSNIINETASKVSQDSTLETIRYNVINNITIRVPNTRLDTVIKSIAKQIDFLDYRLIKADDVSLKILSNKLAQNRGSSTEKRVENAIATKGAKINDVMNAEETLADKKEQNDNAKLNNLSMQDQVNFSTLTLEIYQRETVKQTMVANSKDYNDYKPNIGIRLFDSVKTGWNVLLDILVFLIQIWWLILLALGGFFLYKKYLKKE